MLHFKIVDLDRLLPFLDHTFAGWFESIKSHEGCDKLDLRSTQRENLVGLDEGAPGKCQRRPDAVHHRALFCERGRQWRRRRRVLRKKRQRKIPLAVAAERDVEGISPFL